MFSICNVDGKHDIISGLVEKFISAPSFKPGTEKQVIDFGSCSRRSLADTGFTEYRGERPKFNFRIEGGRRGSNKSRPSKWLTMKDSKNGGSFETNEAGDIRKEIS